MVITNPPTEKKELSYIPYAQKGTVKPKTDITAPYGTYNIKTGVYTSPSGESSSTRNIPSGAKIIYDGPSGGGSSGGGGTGSSPISNLPSSSSTISPSPQEQKLNTYSQNIQNYYASQISKGVQYTPEKLYSLKQSGILQYGSREFNKGEGIKITPEGQVFRTQQKTNPNLFGGGSVSPAYTPLTLKDVDFYGSIFPRESNLRNINLFKSEIKREGTNKRGTIAGYIEERFSYGLSSTYKYFPAGETRDLLFSSARIGDTSITSPRLTDTLKLAFFTPSFTTGQQQYIYNVGKGIVVQEPKTSFISEVTPLKKGFKVITISDTESEGIVLSSLSKQKITGGDKLSIGGGKGFTTDFKQPKILIDSKQFRVYSFNEQIGNFKDLQIVKGLSITEDTFKNTMSIIPKSSYNKNTLINPKQVRLSESLGFISPTSQENTFSYLGTNTGTKFNIQGLIKIKQPRDFIESSFIKSSGLGLGKKTPLVFSNPLGELQQSQIKNIVTTRAIEKSSSINIFRGAIFSSGGGLETKQRLNLSFSNAQTSRQSLSQRSLLKSSFAQPSKLKFSLATSQIQTPEQTQRLKLGSLNALKLEPVFNKNPPPIVPNLAKVNYGIPKAPLFVFSGAKKTPTRKSKKRTISSVRLTTISPSYKFLGIKGGFKL